MKMQDATMMVHHRSAVGRHVAKERLRYRGDAAVVVMLFK